MNGFIDAMVNNEWIPIGVVMLVVLPIVRILFKKIKAVENNAARKLNLQAVHRKDLNEAFPRGEFSLIKSNRWFFIRAIYQGTHSGHPIVLFNQSVADLSESGKHETVVYVKGDGGDFPRFVLRPEGLGHKISEWFGFKDIDFITHPSFSKAYRLKSESECEVRQLFTFDVLSFFESNLNLCVESNGNGIIVFREDELAKPTDWEKHIQRAVAVYHVLRSGVYQPGSAELSRKMLR